jgi:hypothetical protein
MPLDAPVTTAIRSDMQPILPEPRNDTKAGVREQRSYLFGKMERAATVDRGGALRSGDAE